MHSTNYQNTLIRPSPDCKASCAMVPAKDTSVAGQQYARLVDAPYVMTSDDLIVSVQALRKGVDDLAAFRAQFFSRGQACLRASPLVKTCGWAIHHDAEARIALVDPDSDLFAALCEEEVVNVIDGMRNARA